MTSWLLSSGSLTLIVLWLLVGSVGVPLPEEIAVLATGVLIYHELVSPFVAIPVVLAVVLVGDLALFSIARRFGEAALHRPRFQRLLPPARRERLEAAYRRHGGKLVFFARHVAGFRAATFALAGMLGMSTRRFLAWDGLAACVSVPLNVALGYAFALHIDKVRRGMAHAEHWVVLVLVVVTIIYMLLRPIRMRRERSRTIYNDDPLSGRA